MNLVPLRIRTLAGRAWLSLEIGDRTRKRGVPASDGAFDAPERTACEPRSRVVTPSARSGTRPPSRGRALLLFLLVAAAPSAFAQGMVQPAESNLYAGTLTYLDHAYSGGFQVGAKLATLRLVMTLPLPAGLRLAARGDLTALGAIDPNAPDLATSRTVEGYATLSWSRSIAGVSVGPAMMAGALVPTGEAFAWRYEPTYGAGLRLGRGRSWFYALVGKDGASDEECSVRRYGCAAAGDWRPIVAVSIELGRAAIVGDFVGGSIGRVRLGALVRLPNLGAGK